jgi:hypothetical protein
MARTVNGWRMNTDTISVYGNYYLKRAIIALVGLGAKQPDDAIYPLCWLMRMASRSRATAGTSCTSRNAVWPGPNAVHSAATVRHRWRPTRQKTRRARFHPEQKRRNLVIEPGSVSATFQSSSGRALQRARRKDPRPNSQTHGGQDLAARPLQAVPG